MKLGPLGSLLRMLGSILFVIIILIIVFNLIAFLIPIILVFVIVFFIINYFRKLKNKPKKDYVDVKFERKD